MDQQMHAFFKMFKKTVLSLKIKYGSNLSHLLFVAHLVFPPENPKQPWKSGIRIVYAGRSSHRHGQVEKVFLGWRGTKGGTFRQPPDKKLTRVSKD